MNQSTDLNTACFSAELGSSEQCTETYMAVHRGSSATSNTARRKERWQSFGLCPKFDQHVRSIYA